MSDKNTLTDADRDALKTMNVRINKEGTGLVASTMTGEPLEEERMNQAQREAFKRFAAISFPPKKAPAKTEMPSTDALALGTTPPKTTGT